MTIPELFNRALLLWRRAPDLLFRVASVFLFLPALAVMLFVPSIDLVGVPEEGVRDRMVQWFVANAPALSGALLIELIGSTTILVLLLAPERPSVAEAMARALRLFPAMLVAWSVVFLIVMTGSFLFLLPGFYAAGRTMVTGAMLVTRPERGPFAAVADGIRRTRGHGWKLLVVTMAVLGAGQIAAAIVPVTDGRGDTAFEVLEVVSAIASAAASAVLSLTMTLLQVAAFQLLPEAAEPPRQGE